MSFQALFTGIGTLFKGGAVAGAAGAGAGAATAATAGGIFGGGGMTVLGSALGGLGTALMKQSEMDNERDMRREEEARREARYSGAGDAVRFWEDGEQPQGLGAGAATSAAPRPVGQTAPRIGEQYTMGLGAGATPAAAQPQAPAAAPPRYSYDRRTGRLVTS